MGKEWKMKNIKYYQDKCERLEKVITMRECQLRCACDGLEELPFNVEDEIDAEKIRLTIKMTLDAVDAIYDLHQGEKIADGFLEPKKRG